MRNHSPRGNLDFATSRALIFIGVILFIPACGYHEITMSGNEAAAIKTLQTLAVAQRLYNKQHQGNSYGSFDQLVADVNLDRRIVGDAPVVSGYIFTMKITPKANGQQPFFTINADPQQGEGLGATGREHYYIDAKSDAVKVNHQQPAGPNDPTVDQ